MQLKEEQETCRKGGCPMSSSARSPGFAWADVAMEKAQTKLSSAQKRDHLVTKGDNR